jgi:hypothetical protein
MLSHVAVKNFLHGADRGAREQDLAFARICVVILELCATKDRVARTFLSRVRKIQSIIDENAATSGNESSCNGLDAPHDRDDSYMFMLDLGETRLHYLAEDILKMLCYPLTLRPEKADSGTLPYPMIAEAFVNGDVNFARQIASPFDMDEKVEVADFFPPETRLSEAFEWNSEEGRLGEGRFVSNEASYGWNSSAFTGNP